MPFDGVPTFEAGKDWAVLRKQVEARLKALEVYRYSWWVHWRDLADYILPRRYKWLVTPNLWNKGAPVNQRIVDATGTLAARTLASGLMSGVTSPGRPWFRMSTTNDKLNENSDVRAWLADTTTRMQRVMASSNYYTAKAVQYFDLAVFGTAPMLIYEDPESVIHCFNPRAGEYYAACGKKLTVTVLYRKYSASAQEICEEFGLANVSRDVREAFENDRQDTEFVVCHGIEPNPDHMKGYNPPGKTGVPRHWLFREVYWEFNATGEDAKKVLRVRGYTEEQPFSCPRWDAEGNDAYGRSPAMDALGDIKQLQVMTKRLAQAIDKMVNPPMLADPSMKNEPASLLPGAVTYVPTLNGNFGFKPVFQIVPPVQEMVKARDDIRTLINRAFFSDLFLMISQLDTVRSATEIDARKEEKLVQLGPVLERLNNEGLDPDINRIFRIMWRNGMLAKMPDALRGVTLKVQYVSVLADEQRASSTTAIERLTQIVGNIAGAKPEALDKINWDELIDTYADLLLVPPKVLNDKRTLLKLRNTRQQQQTAQTTAAITPALADAAQNLSNTDMGGGQNALQMMFGGPGGGGGGGFGGGLTPASPVAGNA